MSTWGCLTNVVRNEGPLGLYKGLVPQLVGQVPEKAIRLFIVDRIRSLSPSDDVSYPTELLAGLAAGANQVLITNPAEIVKVRLQVQGQELTRMRQTSGAEGALNSTGYSCVISCADKMQLSAVKPKGAISILRELGISGMYKGASACFLRDVPFSGKRDTGFIYIMTYSD